jgi:hypothetical protein
LASWVSEQFGIFLSAFESSRRIQFFFCRIFGESGKFWLKFFEDRVEGFLGEAFDFLWVFGDFVGSIALELDWSGKSTNQFVGWDFFQWVDWTVSANPTRLEGPIFWSWKTRLVHGIFCWILESGWDSWGFLLGPFWVSTSFASTGFWCDDFSFFSGRQQRWNFSELQLLSRTQQTLQFHSQIPSQPPKKLPKISRNFQPKNRVENLLWPLNIFMIHRSQRAIRNFRFFVYFSSREFKIGCKVLFLTPGITHKIPDKNSLFSSSSVSRNENEISWEFRVEKKPGKFEKPMGTGKIVLIKIHV